MPERPRKRKNNKNKRKNNKNKVLNQNSSSNDVPTNIDCRNEEIGQCSVTKVTSSIDKTLHDNLNSDQIENRDLVNNNQLKNVDNTLIASRDDLTRLSTKESEVNIDNNSINSATTESEDKHSNDKWNEFENENHTTNNINNSDRSLYHINQETKAIEISREEGHIDHNLANELNESLNDYLVESPDQKSIKKSKLSSNVKSKSVDNDDCPIIIEVTEEETNTDDIPNLCIIESNNIIITDADTDIEWQKTDELEDSNTIPKNDIKVSSVSTIPLNIAQCHQASTHITDDEDSLRSFLHSLNLATNPDDANTLEIKAEIEHIINREIKHRLRKRGLADDFLFKAGPSRSLTVIDEEGSSESSITSRRQSYLSDKVSDNEDLDDDVFVSEVSQLRSVAKEQHGQVKPVHHIHTSFKAIPQECLRVDAKIKEPEITEARGGWSMKTTEKLTGAELVYLTDSSSSTSSLYDQNDDKDNGDDNDLSVRIITPTIEVTDTEHFLTNTHIFKNNGQNVEKNIQDNITQSNHNVNDTKSVGNKRDDTHEIVIKSTDNIETNLYVKEISDNGKLKEELNIDDEIEKSPKVIDKYDLEMKVIKCELNDAIKCLIKEVRSDTEERTEYIASEDLLQRQDSSSSLGSSQCTAKYNPNHSSLNDVADIINESHNEACSHTNHVKEVYAHVDNHKPEAKIGTNSNYTKQPQSLRQVCLNKISLLPYGNKIIEELANVSERLQSMSSQSTLYTEESKNIFDQKKSVQSKNEKSKPIDNLKHHIIPPPLQPRTSSFKIAKDEHNQEFLSTSEPIYRCLSPSNKMLMEKTKTIVTPNESQRFPQHSDFDHSKSTTIYKNCNEKGNNFRLKSETGSRLLSLIRDTSVKSSSNSNLYKSNTNENMERVSKLNFSEPFRSKYSQSHSTGLSQFDPYKKCLPEIFKPIPPPKFRSFSSSFYESDDSSDLTENKSRKLYNERRYFHYSTGNLSKDIENDVSSIQSMHRNCMIKRDNMDETRPRRPSLPKDLCDQQMEYIRQKEKEVDAEIRRLERENEVNKYKRGPRAPMISEESFERRMLSSAYEKPVIKDLHSSGTEKRQISSIFSSSNEELHREKMYSEYISQMAEREKRKESKIIKITKTSPTANTNMISKSMTALDRVDHKVNNPMESEFITKAKERWNKLGIRDSETEDEKEKECNVYREPKVIEHKIKVIDAGEEKDVKNLPNHLQEFVSFTVKDTEGKSSPGESDSEKPSAHVVILCAVVLLMLAVGRYFMRLIRNI